MPETGSKIKSTAVVPIDATTSAKPASNPLPRPYAAFIAQLIATADRDPQTRTVRRADPVDAMMSYGKTQPARTGRSLSKVA